MSQPPKVLVIEDQQALLKVWIKKFHSQGFSVSAAPTAEAAIKSAAEQHPDLVVVDLPESLGEAAVKKIREFKWGSALPVMFLNSWQDQEIYLSYTSGAEEHLAYNWSLEEVVEKAKRKLGLLARA